VRSVGILAPANDYGNTIMSAYNAVASGAGISTADNVRYPPAQTDLSQLVAQFAHYDSRKDDPNAGMPFDAVLLPAGGEKARAIGGLLNYYNLPASQVRRIGTGLLDDTALATEPSLDGAWFAASAPELRAGFEKRYAQLYGTRPQRLATLAYDATALAAVIARNSFYQTGVAGFDRAGITNPNGFAGIDGVFRFRPDGLIERGLAVMEYHDAQIRVLDPAPTTFQRASY
jgi:hypothetical protein